MDDRCDWRGVALMIISGLCGALVSLFGKHGSTEASVPIAVFMRFAVPIALLLPAFFALKKHLFHWVTLRHFLVRSGLFVTTQICYFYYLSRGTLVDGVLLISTAPLFMPLLARLFMKKPLSKRTVFCLFVGFIGVFCILKPSDGLLDMTALIGLCAGFLLACSQLSLHQVTRITSVTSQLFIVMAMSALLSFLFVPFFSGGLQELGWVISDWGMLLLFLGLAISTVTNQILRSFAYRMVDNPATLAPYMYFTLFFSLVLQVTIYRIWPSFLTIIGAALIIAAALMMRPWRKHPVIGS